MESAILAVLTICVFLSFYFTFLSLQTIEDSLKKHLVTLAAFSLITGVTLFACLTIYLGIKKTFPHVDVEDQIFSGEEQQEYNEG